MYAVKENPSLKKNIKINKLKIIIFTHWFLMSDMSCRSCSMNNRIISQHDPYYYNVDASIAYGF